MYRYQRNNAPAHRRIAEIDERRAVEALTVVLVQPGCHRQVGTEPGRPGPERVLAGIAAGLYGPHSGQVRDDTKRTLQRESPGQHGQISGPCTVAMAAPCCVSAIGKTRRVHSHIGQCGSADAMSLSQRKEIRINRLVEFPGMEVSLTQSSRRPNPPSCGGLADHMNNTKPLPAAHFQSGIHRSCHMRNRGEHEH